jgi:hypothetical protein
MPGARYFIDESRVGADSAEEKHRKSSLLASQVGHGDRVDSRCAGA